MLSSKSEINHDKNHTHPDRRIARLYLHDDFRLRNPRPARPDRHPWALADNHCFFHIYHQPIKNGRDAAVLNWFKWSARCRKEWIPEMSFESSFPGDISKLSGDNMCRECRIYWKVYDPVWQIDPGTPFSRLPDHWICPNCDSPNHKFMAEIK